MAESASTPSCGIYSCRPRWLQNFLSFKMYIVLFMLVGILQSMTFSYLSVVLSTIEKQFGLQSREAAFIYSGNEISQICFFVFFPFIGRVKKRPLAMGLCSIISGIGIFIIAVPYLAGRGNEFISASLVIGSSIDEGLCPDSRVGSCDAKQESKDWLSMGIIFLGILMVGIGSSGIFSFGIPYIDDNAVKSQSPYTLSLAMCSRVLGPAFGYSLGSFTLSIFVQPESTPTEFGQDDHRWVGAWWLGFIILGSILVLISPLMTLFPSVIPPPEGHHTDAQAIRKEELEENEPKSLGEWGKEFLTVTKRLASNRIFVFNLLSSVLTMFAIIGFATFLPKYFEFVLQRRASTSGAVGGVSHALAALVGILLSGFIVGKFRPRASYLAAWCMAVSILGSLVFLGITQMGCATVPFYGSSKTSSLQLGSAPCNSNCSCSVSEFSPVCSVNGKTWFVSPCLAGCKKVRTVQMKNDDMVLKYFYDCQCVADDATSGESANNFTAIDPWWKELEDEAVSLVPPVVERPEARAGDFIDAGVEGFCPSDCDNHFYIVLAFMTLVGVVAATGRMPNTLITLRAIDKKDKGASTTLTLSCVSLFALLPAPLLYGWIYDISCIASAESCGSTLNCYAYDNRRLGVYLGVTSSAFLFLAGICDGFVWYYCKGLHMYHEDGAGDPDGEEMPEVPAKTAK